MTHLPERFVNYTAEDLRGRIQSTGWILRAEDGACVVCIGWDKWLLASPGTVPLVPVGRYVDDARVAAHGSWTTVAYPPATRRHDQVVYLDLDEKGAKVHVARAFRADVQEYERQCAAWEKDPTQRAPSAPTCYTVEYRGLRYIVVPTAWFGVTNAAEWRVLGAPEVTRRARAQATADRRALSEGAARALDAMVWHCLPDPRDGSGGSSGCAMAVADLWIDLTENRANVFSSMRVCAKTSGLYWEVPFTLTEADDALLTDAAYSTRTGQRLIRASLARLKREGWVEEGYRRAFRGDGYAAGFERTAKGIAPSAVQAVTGFDSALARVSAAADVAEGRLRGRTGYWALPAYVTLGACRDAARAARNAVAAPFALPAALDDLARATAALRAATVGVE